MDAPRPAPDNLDADEARRVARFWALIQEGLDDFDAGRYETVDDVGAWLDQIEAELDEASRTA